MNKNWYAVYTKSRTEKKVLSELEFLGVDAYLPLIKKLRQWSDRKKWVEVPLIPGYVFVCITRKEYEKVLKIQGVVTYVRFEGQAAIIPENQIDIIKRMLLETDLNIEVIQKKPAVGECIEVISGPLIGLKGKLLLYQGKKRVIVEITQLNLSLVVDLPLSIITITKE